MNACFCTLGGTAACLNCSNRPVSIYQGQAVPLPQPMFETNVYSLGLIKRLEAIDAEIKELKAKMSGQMSGAK